MGTLEPDPGMHPEPPPTKQPLLSVEITRRECGWEDVNDEDIVRAARAAFTAAQDDTDQCEVSLLLTSDEEIAALNKSWRDMDGPTNVLSFRLDATPCDAGPRALGDVVLARETIEREAAERGIPAGQHAAHLVVHGVLHLLGYDHGTDGEAGEMEDLEVRILATLGLPDPYSFQPATQGEGQ